MTNKEMLFRLTDDDLSLMLVKETQDDDDFTVFSTPDDYRFYTEEDAVNHTSWWLDQEANKVTDVIAPTDSRYGNPRFVTKLKDVRPVKFDFFMGECPDCGFSTMVDSRFCGWCGKTLIKKEDLGE